MNSTKRLAYLLVVSSCVTILSCSKPEDSNISGGDSKAGSSDNYKYFMSYRPDAATKWPTIFKAFKDLPTGELTAGQFEGGLQSKSGAWSPTDVYNNWVFARGSEDGSTSKVVRYDVDPSTGNITKGGEITRHSDDIGAEITIVNETKGYYYNHKDPMAIQIFNPSTMSRTGKIDLSSLSVIKNKTASPAAKYMTKEEMEAVTHEQSGGYMIAVKQGKIYVDVTYNHGNPNPGYSKINKVFVAVLNASTEKFEKIITRDNAKQIGKGGQYRKKWLLTPTNDLYMITYGNGHAVSDYNGERTQAKIIRIKAGQTDFDDSFMIDSNDFTTISDPSKNKGWFHGLEVYKGWLYTFIPDSPLNLDRKKNKDITYSLHKIDLNNTKASVRVDGVPETNYRINNTPFVKDDKLWILIEGGGRPGKKGVLYWYDGNNLEEKFSVENRADDLKYLYPLGDKS